MSEFYEEIAKNAAGSKASHPAGFEPGLEMVGDKGTAVVTMPQVGSSKEDLLREAGFDPEQFSIVGPVRYRKWMRYDQRWLHYYKFDIDEGAESPAQLELSIEEIRQRIQQPTPPVGGAIGGTDAWVYCASDWQIGKGEGDGTRGTIDRVTQSIELAKARVRGLRRAGAHMPAGVLTATGDLGEGTCGFYPAMGYLIDANRRTQNRITRELLTYAIDELRPLFETFTVATVGGNHGENRNQEGKKNTDNADNDDVAQFEAVREAFDRAGSDITWVIPEDELSIMLPIAGVNVALTHGHLFTTGGKLPQAKALEWWKGQDFGFASIREARILISSHFHHFSALAHGARTHFQTPAMDPGSKWVANLWGSDSPAGVLTMRIDPSTPLGWADMEVLSAHRALQLA